MSDLDSFLARLEEKRLLIVVVTLVLQCLTIAALVYSATVGNRPLTFKVPTISTDTELKKRVCFFGFKNLVNGEASRSLFQSDVAEALEDQHEAAFPHKVKEIYEPKLIDSGRCKIIAQDKQGLRVFQLDINGAKGPFGYEIVGIQEKALSGEEEGEL